MFLFTIWNIQYLNFFELKEIYFPSFPIKQGDFLNKVNINIKEQKNLKNIWKQRTIMLVEPGSRLSGTSVLSRRKLNVRDIHINIWWHSNRNVICSKNFITLNILILFEYSIGWSTFNGIYTFYLFYTFQILLFHSISTAIQLQLYDPIKQL